MEDKSFELITKMYSDMMEFRKDVTEQFKDVAEQFKEVKKDIKELKKDVVRIENDLQPKIEAALDGYKQHTDILERIEKEVTKQEEIIMRRVK